MHNSSVSTNIINNISEVYC